MRDQDTGAKYIRLFGTIFFLFVGFLVALALLFFFMRLVFGLLDHMLWVNNLYMFFLVIMPSVFFVGVFLIYAKRTRSFPKPIVKYVSLISFFLIITAWVVACAFDVYTFITKAYTGINYYYSYSLWLCGGSVLLLFLNGILQAFSTPKEEDWIKRHADRS